jgi:TM2 domain-containing membrane protein YozV
MEEERTMTQAGTAAVISLVIPGAGQIYNGDFLRGLFWLIVTPGLWIGSGGTLGWICHFIAALTAHRRAKKYMAGELSA